MSEIKLNEKETKELERLTLEAHQRYLVALGDPRLIALAVGVEMQLVSMGIRTAELLGHVVGHHKADAVVLAAMREAVTSVQAGMRFADRKTES